MESKHYTFARKAGRGAVVLLEAETGTELRLPISPFVYFTESDDVILDLDAPGHVARILKLLAQPGRSGASDTVAVYPYYGQSAMVPLSKNTSIPVVFKEVTTDDEFEQIRYLEQFHYLQAKPSWGRQMYIIAKPTTDEILGTPLPTVLGCVVLTSPSLFSGPRNDILKWHGREVLKEHVDRVVRIARVIVHPEFRGLRLGARLVHHSIEYCRERWNVKGKKAWFVETVAEMSRYHPFFERGGLTYVGNTKAQENAFFFGDDPKTLGIQQGPGQVMASLKRFKQKLHTKKPFLMASLLPPDDPYSAVIRKKALEQKQLVTDQIELVETRLPSPITFERVTVKHHGRTLWDEPIDLNRKWQHTARDAHQDLAAYLDKLSGLLDGLLDSRVTQAGQSHSDEIAPDLRRMKSCVLDAEAALEEISGELESLFARLGAGLASINGHRGGLIGKAKAIRVAIESQLLHLNEDGSSESPAKRRSELNELRLEVQRIEDRLDLGPLSSPQRWVTEAFGVKPGQASTVLRDFSLEVWPGSVVLVVGPSGSGKSTLLSVLNGSLSPDAGQIGPGNIAEFVSALDLNFDPSRPLIDLVGRNEQEAVFLLNHVDLAESHLYMKRRDQLSHGQRYRAAFARMLSDRRPIWLADEFCAFLDPVTTLTLCKGIRKLVRQQGITFVAAAAKEDYIREALQPDIVVKMNAGGLVAPCPKSCHWGLAPQPSEILQALAAELPAKLHPRLASWLRQVELIGNAPDSLGSLTWTEAAQELRRVAQSGLRAYTEALARHVWARDWLFHRLWNRIRYGGRDIQLAKAELDHSGVRNSQLRYRIEFIALLLAEEG